GPHGLPGSRLGAKCRAAGTETGPGAAGARRPPPGPAGRRPSSPPARAPAATRAHLILDGHGPDRVILTRPTGPPAYWRARTGSGLLFPGGKKGGGGRPRWGQGNGHGGTGGTPGAELVWPGADVGDVVAHIARGDVGVELRDGLRPRERLGGHPLGGKPGAVAGVAGQHVEGVVAVALVVEQVDAAGIGRQPRLDLVA